MLEGRVKCWSLKPLLTKKYYADRESYGVENKEGMKNQCWSRFNDFKPIIEKMSIGVLTS